MYLKELEILGFKSFPEKTRLTFEPGITVVVGPNGCGKSNVFDAMKWSLGEQSPKSLRGAKMEDIIFSGTENIPALNYAEVTLTFSNEDNYLPIEYKEVAVTRRLYRSGESQYFINKNPVRLKDIEELFLGTGIGESTYSFVEQGKIEIFLSYKPEDKRLIFDEASGIIKYKERRKETLKKLQEVDDNLLRLEDIMSEVRRQIRYLERQVEKARKYKEVQAQLLEVEQRIATMQDCHLNSQIEALRQELGSLEASQQEKDSGLAAAHRQWDEFEAQRANLRNQLEEATTAIVSLKAHRESAQNNILVYQLRARELEERLVFLQQSLNEASGRLRLQEARSHEERLRLENIQSDVNRIHSQIQQLEEEKSTCLSVTQEAQKVLTEQKSVILGLEEECVRQRNAIIEVQATLQGFLNRKKRLLLDAARLETLAGENKQQLVAAGDEFSKAESELNVLSSQRSNLTVRSKEIETLTENIRTALVEKEKEFLELNATFEFLKDLRVKYETFSTTKRITVIFEEEPKDINTLVASLKNAVFSRDGNAYRAAIDAKVVAFEETQLKERIQIVTTETTGLKAKLADLDREKSATSEAIVTQDDLLQTGRVRLAERLKERDTLAREMERFNEESGLLEEEKRTTLEDIQTHEARQKELERALALAESSLTHANSRLAQSQEAISASAERIKEIDISITRDRGHIDVFYKEKETLASKVSFFEEELNSLRRSLEQIEKEKQENESQRISFSSQVEVLKRKIEEDASTIQHHTDIKQNLEVKEQNLNQDINRAKEIITVCDRESQAARATTYNKKLQIQSLEYEKEKIADYLQQVYHVELTVPSGEEPDQSLDELSASRDRLKNQVQSLGEVNLVAIEEFEELRKRNDFLETQKQDLITSKENLKKAIQKINRTSRELFLETFEKIQEEFKKNFRYLFNGGRASLILLDPEDVLESGVEIEVQPPGKKLQNVSLLSGGEKSLTAISLIFAIFRVRPSPLCALDEIDAPLDEANVDRFNSLLKEFAAHSQFVLITHNKKTMANADVLYGVTMQERGVSKLVSVKFASETEEAPTATPSS